MTTERLATFDHAWERADVAALSEFLTEDCVYSASIGPEPGTTFVGKSAVVRGFRDLLAYEKEVAERAAAHTESLGDPPRSPLFIHGHRGFAQWAYPSFDDRGHASWVRGCDFFEFEGPLIRKKDAFIKNAALLGAPPRVKERKT